MSAGYHETGSLGIQRGTAAIITRVQNCLYLICSAVCRRGKSQFPFTIGHCRLRVKRSIITMQNRPTDDSISYRCRTNRRRYTYGAFRQNSWCIKYQLCNLCFLEVSVECCCSIFLIPRVRACARFIIVSRAEWFKNIIVTHERVAVSCRRSRYRSRHRSIVSRCLGR